MRMTNNMIVNNMLWNTNRNLNSMANLNNQLSTGRKIHRPSDDPVGTTFIMKYKTDVRETEQYQANVSDSLGWMEVTESAMHNVKDIMQRIRELTVQAANGTNTQEDRQKIQIEVDEMIRELRVLGNTTSAGRYVFSGLNTDEKLFHDNDNLAAFNPAINMGIPGEHENRVKEYEVSVGETIPVGTHPIDIFGIQPMLDSDGEPIPRLDENGDPILKLDENGDPIPRLDEDGDPILDINGDPTYHYHSYYESKLIADLHALSQAIGDDEHDGIQQGLADIDEHMEKVLASLGEVGGKTNRVEFINLRLQENALTFTSLLSEVQDVDMAEAIMHFQNLENVYRASLAVGAKVIQPSLVDFIR